MKDKNKKILKRNIQMTQPHTCKMLKYSFTIMQDMVMTRCLKSTKQSKAKKENGGDEGRSSLCNSGVNVRKKTSRCVS